MRPWRFQVTIDEHDPYGGFSSVSSGGNSLGCEIALAMCKFGPVFMDVTVSEMIETLEDDLDREDVWEGRRQNVENLRAAANAVLAGWAEHRREKQTACAEGNESE